MSENNKTKPAIAVRGITKSFRIPLDGSSGIKQKIVNIFSRKKGHRDFTPLKDVSFEIQKGEFFGIVGRNGSGKSTLLKTIAGIYTPERGHVKVNGLLVPFIELGVGFNPELTGKENVYLNAALLGFSRNETDAMYEEIVDFAELHDFMEERLKNYSSGMQVRLAFSIAIRAKGDILLLDEVLAVGDNSFQQKCFDYFEKIKEEKRTIILVTHSMDAVKRFCSRALLLEGGEIKLIGSPVEIADQYLLDNIRTSSGGSAVHEYGSNEQVSRLEATINSNEYSRFDSMKINYTYKLLSEIDIYLGLSIIRDGKSVAEINSLESNLLGNKNKDHETVLHFPLDVFNPGEYSVNVSIFEKQTKKMLDYKIKTDTFIITGDDQTRGGAIHLNGTWT